MAELVIRGGRVVDATGSRPADVLVRNDVVVAVQEGLEVPAGARVLDAGACVVAPGLVDLHTHVRQPGQEESETIETAARAAALGGYTAVLAMPNTEPAIDSPGVVREVRALAAGAPCHVAVSASITVGREGQQLSPLGELAALGVRWFTDDGTGVQDARLMRRALEYAAGLDVVLAQHCEDASMAAGGCMHEGPVSSRLGLPGQPSEAEELMVMRDIALSRLTGARVHFMHLSTAGSVAMVRAARAGGLPVTAEVTPHHLSLTHDAVEGYDPVFRVNPPLRTGGDTEALRAALADGTIDVVATDHAPHPPEAKEEPFDRAAPGMLGLETALAVVLTATDLSLDDVLARCAWRPAALLGLARHGGPVEPGRPANLCVVDPSTEWQVDARSLASRSRNTPYAGSTLRGRVRHTVFEGEPVVIDGELQR